jgi:serine/threonine-protein kinase haspin
MPRDPSSTAQRDPRLWYLLISRRGRDSSSTLGAAMLGSKTKRVAVYGKRAHRVVASDDLSRTTVNRRTTTSPPVAVIVLDDPASDTSPIPSPVKSKPSSPVVKKKSTTRKKVASKPTDRSASARRPLAPREPAVSSNVESKQLPRPPTKLAKKPPPSPVVDVEIVVLDDQGRTVAKERRVSKTGAQVNPVTTSPSPSRPRHDKKNTEAQKPRKVHVAKPTVIEIHSDSEPELPVPRQKRAATRRRPIVISSDEDEPGEKDVPKTPTLIAPSIPSPPVSRSRSSSSPRMPTSPHKHSSPTRTKQRRSSPRLSQYDPFTNKSRQLTPIRRGKKSSLQSPGSVISLENDESDLDDTDVNDILKFADLSISDYQEHAPEVPGYLLPLLQECNQGSPHEFSSFINSFPFDPIVQSYESELAAYSKAEFRKVGEASYSEVFGIGSVVLKIVPLRDEVETKTDGHDVESPPPSDARDVLQEIAITRSMGELCEGFTKLFRTYIVRGKYPSLLLSLWDEYNVVKGSESIKPGEWGAPSDIFVLLMSSLPRHILSVAGICHHRPSEWWPRPGNIHILIPFKEWMGTSL